jgi:hypothetical protein
MTVNTAQFNLHQNYCLPIAQTTACLTFETLRGFSQRPLLIGLLYVDEGTRNLVQP